MIKFRWFSFLLVVLVVSTILMFFAYIQFTSLNDISSSHNYIPNQSQMEFFLEYCDIDHNGSSKAELLFTEKSPHKSDSKMALIFDGDIKDICSDYIVYPTKNEIVLSDQVAVYIDAQKQYSDFIKIYRLHEKEQLLIVVTNVSADTLDTLNSMETVH